MMLLLSKQMQKDDPAANEKEISKYGESKDKIFGLSLAVFCKLMIRLFHSGDDDDSPRAGTESEATTPLKGPEIHKIKGTSTNRRK